MLYVKNTNDIFSPINPMRAIRYSCSIRLVLTTCKRKNTFGKVSAW